MNNHLKYWLSLNHHERIKRYGFFTHLKYIFNFNINGIVVNLQTDLVNLPELEIPRGYSVQKMDVNDNKQIESWIHIVNNSYTDANETKASFKNLVDNHSFLENVEVFFIINELGMKVGTVSTGLFRKNNDFGGDARIAVLPSERGSGLGLYAIFYAFKSLKDKGLQYGESIITLKRTASIWLHFKLGFVPIFNRNKINFDVQKRMWPARLIAKKRLTKLYKKYLNQT